MPRLMKRCLLALLLFLAALSALELSLRWIGYIPEGFYLARYYPGVPGDLEPNLHMVEALYPDRKYSIATTSQGTRGLRPFSPAKPAGSLRVLCLGDFFTFSAGVDDSDTYPEQLANDLAQRAPNTPIDVINAGIPRYGLLDEIDYYLEKGRPLHPDVVVLQLYANDFQDHLRGTVFRETQRLFSPYAHRSWLTRAFGWSRICQWFEARYPVWTKTNSVIQRLNRDVRACEGFDPALDPILFCPTPEETTFMNDRNKLLGQADTPTFARVRDSFRHSLEFFRDTLAADGVQLVVLSIPDRWQVGGYRNAVNSIIARQTVGLGIDTIDMTSPFRSCLFRDRVNPYMVNGDDHCSAWGNHLLARTVAEALDISRDKQGVPRLTVRHQPHAFDYADQSLVRLWVEKDAWLRPEAPIGIRATVEEASGLVFDAAPSMSINALHPKSRNGEPAEIVVRVDSPFPLSRADIRFPRNIDCDTQGISRVSAWISADRTSWRLLDDLKSDKTGAPGSYEQYTLAAPPFDTRFPRTFWLKFRMTGAATIYSEREEGGNRERCFEIYLNPAPAAAHPS